MGEYERLVQSSFGGDVCEHGASLDQVSLFQNISVKSFFKIVQTIIIMWMKNTPADYASMTIRISNSEVGVITLVFRRHKLQTGYTYRTRPAISPLRAFLQGDMVTLL